MNYSAPGMQTLLVDTEGNLWVATDGFNYGLGDPKIEPNTILKLSPDKSVFEETGTDFGMVWNIKEAPDKSIWATNTSSIKIKQGNEKAGEKLSVLVGGSPMTLHFGEASDLWIGFFDSGIYKTKDFRKMEPNSFDKFPLKTGNSYQAIFSVFEDREGNIWFGTDNGIHRFRENKVKSFSIQEGLPYDKQLAVISSSNGTPNFFAYTESSLLSFSDNKFTDFVLPAYSQFDSTRMLSIYSDPDGTLWLGGSFGIAEKFNEKVTYIKHPEIENRAMVEAIVKDKEGNIWFTITGTDSISRIMRLKNNQITNFSEIVELPKYRSRILFADQTGKVWFGFENGVIAVYENSSFRFYSAKDGLPSGKIFVITKDKKDNILIGSEGGLSRFENGSFKTLTTENGLLGNSVSGIIEDNDGFIWLAESTAIFRVSPEELELSFSDPAHKMQGIAFDANDGLRGLPRQHEPFPTAAKGGDGKLWFTTTAGISVIDPRNWHKNTVIPPVTVEYVKIDDEIVSDFDKLELQPNSKNILFKYTALSLSNPERVFFRYKLEGYDQDWRDSTHRREAGYTNLPPGKYVFRVIACNNDGVWNEEGASLSFTILPAFYQTLWFFILCFAAFIAVCLFLYQRRLQQVKKRLNMQFEERLSERTRIARELHDSLLQGIVSASMQLNVTADNLPQNSKTKPQLNRVINLIGEVIKEGRNTLHATYDESITRVLNIYEKVHREVPIDKLGWFIDHAETISEKNIDRIKALGGGIAIQHRMMFQAEDFAERYGAEKLKHSPPIQKMLSAGVPVGAGTDATRVASYNPFVSLYWLISGKSLGGLQMHDETNRLDRMEALRLWTVGSSWFSGESGKKGSIEVGQLADLAILSKDFFSIPEIEIKSLESVLTIVGGKIVYATEDFKNLAPKELPISPDWSPVKTFSKTNLSETANLQSHNHLNCSNTHSILTSTKKKLKQNFDVFGNDWGFACGCAF